MHPDIEDLLPLVTKASRYLGNEINAVKKDPASVDLTFAFAFPDTYEVGMSHVGLQLLYHVLNSMPRVACERAFAPWPDMEAEMKSAGIPLSTLESGIPLDRCDIVGFSLEYELSYATVLRMLALAAIPLRAAQRDEARPLVIAGGPSCCNPEPFADFFDAFVIGEGEDVLQDLCSAYLAWKESGQDRAALLERLAGIPGIYVPSFFSVTYQDNGSIAAVQPLKKGYDRVEKRVLADLTGAPWSTAPVVPYMQVIHDRAGIEIARGCTRGCRFCMAGMIYRPVREKSIDELCRLSRETLDGTGYEELGLLSLSSGDHSAIEPLITGLIDEHGSRKTALSLPSLRVESLTDDMIHKIKQIRKTGFTIAPEAGTQRLRNAINKGFSDEEILGTAQRIFAAGWKLIKLYFMIGLPTETTADIEGIIGLCRDMARLDRRKNLNISISTFIPKPHTPFQRESFAGRDSITEKQRYLKDRLRSRTVQVKYHDWRVSELEAVFSRGDRRLAAVLEQALALGAGYDAWSEHFRHDVWDRAFDNAGLDKTFYLRLIPDDEILPWDHISYGVSSSFLLAERDKARRGETTADCRSGPCTGCGVCRATGTAPRVGGPGPIEQPPAGVSPPQPDAIFRYRLTYAKTGPARFLSHLEFSSSVIRGMRRAGLPLRYSQGFHPLPRVTFHEALPVGIECREARCDLELTAHMAAADVAEKLAPRLPPGITLLGVTENLLKTQSAADTIKVYAIGFPKHVRQIPGREAAGRCIEEFNCRDACIIQVQKKERRIDVDLKQLVTGLRLTDDGSVLLELDTAGRSVPRITDIAGELFGLGQRERKLLRIVSLRHDL